jgi:hypothetical protein
VDVQSLIDDWERIRATVPPAKVESAFAGDSSVAEIQLMSRQQEVWEAYVCLSGFCELTGASPGDVLEHIRTGIFNAGVPASREAADFIDYSAQYWTVGRKNFLTGAVKVKTLLAEQRITVQSSTLDKLQECRAKHEPDWDKVWKCVRAGGGQRAQSAAG